MNFPSGIKVSLYLIEYKNIHKNKFSEETTLKKPAMAHYHLGGVEMS
jgi:hypothetical protein